MPQTATVKQISVKDGDNAKGHWVSTLITTTEGAKVITFEAGAAYLKVGDEFEFEPEIKGDKVNIKRGTFKIVKRGTFKIVKVAESIQGEQRSGNGVGGYKRDTEGITHEYRLKAELQRLERISIEAQTAYKAVMEFAASGVAEDDVVQPILTKALAWATMKLEASMGLAVSPEHAQGKAQAEQDGAQSHSAVSTTPAGGADAQCRTCRRRRVT